MKEIRTPLDLKRDTGNSEGAFASPPHIKPPVLSHLLRFGLVALASGLPLVAAIGQLEPESPGAIDAVALVEDEVAVMQFNFVVGDCVGEVQ